MAVAMRTNGLHHAISLGNIEAPSKEINTLQYEKCYDSDDDNMSRHRLRTSSSSELYPKTSVYSKGDIREQYCLTDRQLNSIERPRRERFFGCLSRHSAPQSFLGVCVGRRAPSDENLAAYAPFYKYPRYQHHHQRDEKAHETDLESSYFRRQPASILSTAKMPDSAIGNRFSWTDSHATSSQEDPVCANDQRVRCSLYPVENTYQDLCIINPFNREQHLISNPANCLYGYATHSILPTVPQLPGPSTPRTKHVSFARSHTLTSFDDVNLGLRSSGRMKTAQSQERLIGGKKPIIASGSIYEPVHVLTNASTSQILSDGTQMSATAHSNILQHPHMHGHQHGHAHAHQHHHGTPFHVHQIVPVFHQDLDPQTFDPRHKEMPDSFIGIGGISIPFPARALAPPSPEIVLVEKKFRNAMKTQATQTELRKDGTKHNMEASPQTVYKVKVVSQGAQTNGLINGKKLTKSLSEMPNDSTMKQHDGERAAFGLKMSLGDHDALHRTQSEEPPRSPKQIFGKPSQENQINLKYYNPPAPPLAMQTLVRRNSRIPSVDSTQSYSFDDKIPPTSSVQSITTHSDIKCEELNPTFISYEDSSANYEDSYGMSPFDYESNSLPRRACSYHRLDNDLYSHSLPRRDPIYPQETCRHITDCTELLGDTNIAEYPRQHLLPPPRQYRKDTEEPLTFTTSHQLIEPPSLAGTNRRMSMVVSMQSCMDDTPFKRDDIRRQSMPVPTRTQRFVDGYVNLNKPEKTKPTFDSADEKEIFIDFKPHISTTDTTKKQQKHRKVQKSVSDGEILTIAQHKKPEDDSMSNASVESSMIADAESECDEQEEEEEEEKEDPLYENVHCYNLMMSESEKRNRFRKRSISLEDAGTKKENVIAKSAPPSPCQDELLVNASTYPSSDSLANDLTRDHSDGIWNESQVTVLTADTRDLNDPEHCSNLLLTPSSKRKNLILQHQQRSSIDTDALDFEDQFTDHSPTFSILSSKAPPTPTRNVVQPKSREFNTTLSVPMSIATPIIAVTPTASTTNELEQRTVRKSPSNSRRSSKSLSPIMQDVRKMEQTPSQGNQHKNAETQNSGNYCVYFRSEAGKNNTDLSECSTNTDEYVTCTDTSKRTPGIKTPPTTTSSSSTTQVPVSAQSSQTEKTHGGSSFESASSLYSSRGDVIFDDITQVEEKLTKLKSETGSTLGLADMLTQETKLSPSHSISSTSSGSYNMKGNKISSPSKISRCDAMAQTTTTSLLIITPPTKATGVSAHLERPTVTKKTESISDDERSDKRYSSSGYYESPHDEEHSVAGKFRRHRQEEDRKRRRTIMKLDIEKENIRALTSPIKKSEVQSVAPTHKEQSPEKQFITNNLEATTSPSKMKRFRPKIRRQFRRSSRDGENTPRRQKNQVALHGLPTPANTEKLLDVSIIETVPKSAEVDIIHGRISPTGRIQSCSPTEVPTKPPVSSTTPNADCYQLKAKSVESLRSVSPGSDSVFYSEADGTTGNDPHSHCLHCGKEMEAANAKAAVGAGDSVESLAGIENDIEQDIVKPPSDFADSPVATKTTQRLYKKMDKRFRSEERYNTERGRHYKSRQENIRAKSEERGREKCTRSPQTLRPSGSSPCVLPDVSNEQRNQIIYRGHYDHGRYSRLTDADVWMQLDHQSFDRQRDRRASTESEKSFHAKFQVILHRLVQRRCTLEMYHRQKNNNFKLISSNSSPDSVRRKLEDILKLMLLVWAREGQVLSKIAQEKHGIDKTVVVKSDSGEFGFRIHGSKPVVVAAIEPDTPAESSGLEVGDIIISVNGVQVLDKHHTEVVKIAHAGCDTLELEVARTIGVLMNEQQEPPSKPLFSGYLWRQSGQAKGTPNTKKWVRRWFCLRPDHCLYYYKTEEDTQPVGAMIMAKHTVEQCSQDIGKPFAFKIDFGEGIPMYVAADSEELAHQWMNTLKHSAVQADPWLEKCARTLQMPPSGILRPDCFGYLMKLGSRWCGWSKRYCVLKDACLYFYQDANSKNSFGMACLQGYKVASMSTNASGRKNSFEIIPMEPKLRHYYFSTESEMDKKRWISALEYSIDRWIKSG